MGEVCDTSAAKTNCCWLRFKIVATTSCVFPNIFAATIVTLQLIGQVTSFLLFPLFTCFFLVQLLGIQTAY